MTLKLNDNLRLEIEATGTGLPNLVKNPSGEGGAWGWVTPVAGSYMYQGNIGGQHTIGFRAPTSSTACYFTTEYLSVAAGKYVAARIDVPSITASHNVKLRFEWYNSSKTLLSSSTQGSAISSGTGYYAAVVAPANTAYVKLRADFYNGTGNPSGFAQVDLRNVMVTWANTNSFGTTRTNLVINPSFETNTTGWGGVSGSTITRLTTAANTGSAALSVTPAAGNTFAQTYTSTAISVTGGLDYTASMYMKAATIARTAQFTLSFYSSTGAIIYTNGVTAVDSTSSWTRVSFSVTAPAAAVTCKLFINFTSVASSEAHYVDSVMFEQATALGSYFDGNFATSGTLSYAWTGTANASTSTESNTSFAYSDPITWENILGPTNEITIDRKALDVGTLSASVHDALLDPAVATNIAPGKGIRLRALIDSAAGTWENVYEGRIDNANVSYDLDTKSNQVKTTIVLTANDNISVLANQGEGRGVGTIAELPYLLEGKGVPWNVNDSGNQVTSATQVSYNENASVVDQVAVTRDSVSGYAWVNRYNVLNAYDAANMPTSVYCTFSDVANVSTSYDEYTSIDAGYNTADVINQVTVKWLRFNASTSDTEEVTYGPYSDATSVATYGPHPVEFTWQGTSESSSAIASAANAIIAANKTPVRKAHGLTLAVRDTRSLTHATQIDLYSKVGVVFSSIINANYRVTSISHKIYADMKGGKWSVDYGFGVDGATAAPTWTPSPPSDKALDGVWQSLTLINGWTAVSGYSTPAYMRKNGIVYVKGVIKNTAGNVIITTLPAGYIPAERHIFSPATSTTAGAYLAGRVDVLTNGQIAYQGGGFANLFSLDGISFPAEL